MHRVAPLVWLVAAACHGSRGSDAVSIELPARGFDVHAVLGQPKDNVDKVLGRGTQLGDGPWLYDGFERVPVHVVFADGRAASVAVDPVDYRGAAADKAALLAWLHADGSEDFDRIHSFDYELEIWAPGAQDRQLVRRTIATQLAQMLEPHGGTATANYTMLTVVPDPGDASCENAALLEKLRDGLAKSGVDLTKAGFDTLECNVGGPRLKLR